MNIYNDWGLTNSPFSTYPLPPTKDGRLQLIGRDKELQRIKIRLGTSSNMLTIEGNNGVGKTSLINVATYELYNEFIEKGEGTFFIPCDKIFQITPTKNIDDFIDEVLLEVTQTLLTKSAELKSLYASLPSNKSIEKLISYSNDIEHFFIEAAPNKTLGVRRSEFRIKILDYLMDVFPYKMVELYVY